MPERKLEMEFQLFLSFSNVPTFLFLFSLSVVFEFKKRWRKKIRIFLPLPPLWNTIKLIFMCDEIGGGELSSSLFFLQCKLREQSQWWRKVIWSEIDFTLKLRHVLSFSMIGFTPARAELVFNIGRRAVFAVNSTFNSRNFELTWQAELSCATTSK